MVPIKPAITLKGRKFKELSGWSGKPLHPPLTDFPVTCYVLVGLFDIISYALGGARSTGQGVNVETSGDHPALARIGKGRIPRRALKRGPRCSLCLKTNYNKRSGENGKRISHAVLSRTWHDPKRMDHPG
jgi:hypothetical protein